MHVVADPRLVRRVVRQQRQLTGLGLDVPHGHCCVIERKPLLAVVSESELGHKECDLPDVIILIARPDDESEDPRAVWRRSFHGHVHHHLEKRTRDGTLTDALARSRINAIGQTEFDEIRAVLHDEALLFSKRDDREAYIEFAAFWLELACFDPDSLPKYFPTIRHAARIDKVLALDIECDVLLDGSRPKGAPDPISRTVPSTTPPKDLVRGDVRRRTSQRLSKAENEARASAAKKKGNVVRSMLMHLETDESAKADEDIDELAHRLSGALLARGTLAMEGAPTIEAWREVIRPLAALAAQSDSPGVLEARVLHDLQKACVDVERERRAVDAITWATSFFRRPLIRPLPMVGIVRTARHLQHAFDTSHHAALTKANRHVLEEVFQAAIRRARANVRRAVKPVFEGVLDEVGLVPQSVPERVAREKLCEEVLDLIHQRGSIGLSQFRDALSRSNLKLPNLTAWGLVWGDPILRADALLSERLDGVYRRGEIYLRGLQKVSSIAFGTRLGRLFTLHIALPLLLSFVLLEGLQHVIHPLAHAFGVHHPPEIMSRESYIAMCVIFYGAIHSDAARSFLIGILRGIGAVLHAIIIGIPRFILRSSPVRALLSNRIASIVLRSLLVLAPAYWIGQRFFDLEPQQALIAGAALFVVLAIFQSTRLGLHVEEAAQDMLVRRARELSRRWLPGLFAFIGDVFKNFVEHIDRGIHQVDEWLTFKQGQSSLSLVAKGVLGTFWFFITYLLRIYVNVLIEPQINPIKHFPVVTVSHKIVLPMSPTLIGIIRKPLSPLGPAIANTIAGTTVLLIPGMFGFLVWELKTNFQLYAQNRSRMLGTVSIGHHGETMNGLLVLGFHAGTVPKLFAKARASRGKLKANAYRAKIHEVEHALTEFIERELVGLLREAKRWTAGELEVVAIELGSNRIRVGIACLPSRDSRGSLSSDADSDKQEVPSEEDDVAWIHFEEQSGHLVASVAATGFIDALPEDQRATLETALAGLYQRAGVDIVREQVEALIGKGTPYDIADEGLVVWPGAKEGAKEGANDDGYRTEVVYPLTMKGRQNSLEATMVRGEPLEAPPAVFDANQLLYSRQKIEWSTWVDAFKESADPISRRVIKGPNLLPSRSSDLAEKR